MVYRTFRLFPGGAKAFGVRISTIPFEAGLALVTIWTAILGFYDGTVTAQLFTDALPKNLVIMFNIGYLISGFAIIAGIGWAYRNLEAFGLTILITALTMRFVALAMTVGFLDITIASMIQSTVFGLACLAKLIILLKRKDIILVDLDKVVTERHGIDRAARG